MAKERVKWFGEAGEEVRCGERKGRKEADYGRWGDVGEREGVEDGESKGEQGGSVEGKGDGSWGKVYYTIDKGRDNRSEVTGTKKI